MLGRSAAIAEMRNLGDRRSTAELLLSEHPTRPAMIVPHVLDALALAKEIGWTEGREVQIEYRWFAGDPERAQAYAADLVKLKPEVIFAGTAPSLAPLQRETRSVPIVFAQVADPVGGGLLPAWHGRAAISPDSLNSSMRSVRSGWNCSSRSPYPILGSGLF